MQTGPDSTLYWVGLSSIPGIGRITFRRLADRCGSPECALAASREKLKEIDGLSDKVIDAIGTFPWQERAEQELARAKSAGVTIVRSDEDAFPERLRTTPDPPLYLYVKGTLQPEDRKALAIVGTRKPTHYGVNVTLRIAEELASAGLTIVSGLARGIDTQAHKGALVAHGRTIAVLGCGIDVPYPPENRGLMEDIARSGAVVTENPFGTKPEAGYFPARNRIISGLAVGTVIIEAAEDSGSLITAQYAREQERLLFAVPGNIGSATSKGPNSLIKSGALLVESANDILAHLEGMGATRRRTTPKPLPPLTREEDDVLRFIDNEPKHIDRIMTESSVAAGKLSGALMTLELKGVVKQLPGKYFIRNE